MTALSIVALAIYIFGAYAYGSVVVLSLRHRSPVWVPRHAPDPSKVKSNVHGMAMFVLCTLWFILHSINEFRGLLGQPRTTDLIDVAALELVFGFPGLIFHTVLIEAAAGKEGPPPRGRLWSFVLFALYASGAALAIYAPAAMAGLVPAPVPLGAILGFSVGLLFTISSICSMAVMATRRRPSPTTDQRRLHGAMMILFAVMIIVFFPLSLMREQLFLMQFLEKGVRMLPLLFLIVSVYFENRIEFYDLVIKRGVILLLTLLLGGAVFGLSLDWLDRLPAGPVRPWLFAILLLPLAMVMPWLHHRVGRALDRLWFGREFTPVEAIKHVLGAMQQATDETTLLSATETTLSEMFRTRIAIAFEDQALPDNAIVSELHTPGSATPIKLAVVSGPGSRVMLSEDLALLRSLGGVFGFMLENVRLQRKRQEQEAVSQELRLQTSRSELKALRAQINPHFLFNALNAIASLIHTDPARADAAVEQLAEVFRYTLRRSDSEWAPLDQELAFARAYLDVEQARFGKRLTFAITADGESQRAHVPSMLLQTLVENAVKHGISRLRQPGHIDVVATAGDGRLTLEVRDTGLGLGQVETRSSSGESFGLRSIRDRLRGHFGERANLELTRDAANTQTIARITMPLTSEEVAAHA